jgi:DNA-directed RNA polymerase subunit RPC12/RpoP
METYSRSLKYLLSSYFLALGKLSFVVGFAVLGASVYFGSESANFENTIDPDPVIMKYALLILLIWVVAILSSIVAALGLSCDKCRSKLLVTDHGHQSKIKRSRLVSFFLPDDLFEKKFTCSQCHSEFSL